MAVKKPIVNYSGKFKELQSGDTISAGVSSGTFSDMQALASPTAGQSFYLTDYLPGVWEYHSFASEWKYKPSIADLVFQQQFGIVPFSATTGTYTHFRRLGSGTGNSGTLTPDTTGLTKFGAYLSIGTGTTSTGYANLDGSGSVIKSSTTKKAAFIHRARVTTLANGTDDFNISLGQSAQTIASAQGVFFWYNQSVSGANWQAVSTRGFSASGNATTTITDTGIAVDTSFHEFVVLFEAGSTARFYIDGTLVATISTTATLPTANGDLYNGLAIRKTVGTTARTLDIDYLTGYVYKR